LRNHDHAAFEVVCYSGVASGDAVTREIISRTDEWRPIHALSDEAVAAQIRADRIDILVDLSGHTAGNRLLVFARKPAPVQVTAWGHATGTGLPAMDYLFSDPVVVPEAVRPLFAEAIYDLPCFIPYQPFTEAPPISEPLANSRGFVTFGCLNRLSKVSPATFRLWAHILHAVSGSRLLLKDRALDDPAQHARVHDALAQHDIGPGRIELRGASSWGQHLATFNEVDIALDPFPQNGGISTWEALWMGVPVVAKLGNSVPSRLSAAILAGIGLADWVADGEDEYLALAIRKSSDIATLARLRKELRVCIMASAAGNPRSYTRAVEDAYRTMWRRWCDKQRGF